MKHALLTALPFLAFAAPAFADQKVADCTLTRLATEEAITPVDIAVEIRSTSVVIAGESAPWDAEAAVMDDGKAMAMLMKDGEFHSYFTIGSSGTAVWSYKDETGRNLSYSSTCEVAR